MRVFWRFLQLYLLLFFVCLAESLYAAPKYYFKQISLENGLSQSSVKCVLVDERGVMWIGTRFGLNRFDREKITVYQEERENLHSLPYNDIVFLEEDAEGNIWVGTSRGLACFERDTQKFMRQEIDGQPLVAACSLLMPEGIYFLGKQGVFCYSYAEKKMIRCKFKESPFEFSPNYVYLYDEKERKVILSFLEKGLWWYSLDTGDMERVSFIPKGNIPSMYIDSFKRIWVAIYNKGVFCYDREGRLQEHLETPKRLTHNIVQDMCEKDGELWLATDGGGINIYNYKNKTVRAIMHLPGDRHSLPVNSFACLYIDDEDNVWAGSIRGGLIGIKPVFMTTYRDAPPGASYGLIYISGVEGLVRIRPDYDIHEEEDFSVSMINLALDGAPIHPDGISGEQAISIPWDYVSFGLSVIVKEKDLMRKKLFRFYIKGDREELLETSSHAFTFPALSPGNYELWVSYSKKNGDWSVPLRLLTVDVEPPLWRRAWFLIAMGMIVFAAIGGMIWSVMRRKERKLAWAMKEHERKFYEEKVRFMVNISHELRTPLTLIYAPLKRLLKSGKVTDKDVSRQLDGLLLQTCRMREIVDMVLDAQKSDTNGDVMDIRFYDLNDWIRSVTDDFIMEFEARRISVRFQLDASVEKVPFDTSKCRVVLSNLLINAMKFSDPDTSLVIGTERMDKNVRVFLADQGIGLRHVDINRLFTCFYQGEHDRKGSGIGLAYARKLIELHGGSIGAYNNEDGGATFYFDLPFTQAFVAAEPDSVIDLSVKGTDKPETDVCGVQVDTELAKYTLLVVEDEIELRNYLLGVLQAEFKEVFVAGDGEEAWEILGQCQPDIVISDVMMPRTDGFELCYRIKNDVAVSHIPVVLLTARVDQASSVEGYKSGADIYLAKPFDIDSLLVILRNILRQRDLLRVRYRESGCLFSPKEDATSNADEQFMCKLNTLLRENLSNPDLNVPFIASAMAMSRTTLYSKFSHLSDVSVGDYVIRFRMVEASRLLSSHKDISIQEVADRVGFSSARYFSTAFKQSYGVTPTEYRRNN